jgi:hypothetical protein
MAEADRAFEEDETTRAGEGGLVVCVQLRGRARFGLVLRYFRLDRLPLPRRVSIFSVTAFTSLANAPGLTVSLAWLSPEMMLPTPISRPSIWDKASASNFIPAL